MYGGEAELTDSDLKLLCDKQLAIAKLLDSNIPYTVEDVKKSFEFWERDAEENIEKYKDNIFEYSFSNWFDVLFLTLEKLDYFLWKHKKKYTYRKYIIYMLK